MSFTIPNEVPAEVKNALAPLNATKTVTDSAGNPQVVADDYLLGKSTFDPMYDYSKGDLATLDKSAGSLLDSWIIITNPNASPGARLAALGVMVTLIVGAAKTAAFALVFGSTVAATVPVVGYVVLMVIAVAVVVALIMSAIFPETEYQERTPEQKFNLRINRIPANLPLPQKLSPPDADAQQAIKLLGEIFMYEQKGQSRPDLRLDLANTLRGQAGLADDIYRIVADVVFDTRWQGGKIFPLYFGDPSWNRNAFQSWVENGRFVIPRSLPIEEFAFGTNPPVNAANFREAEGEFILYVPPGTEFLPQNNQAGAPDPFPYGVGRYLLIFSVLYGLSNPKEARAATYASVYLILIQKAWGYKAAGKEIPVGLYNSMGFLLDKLANAPVAYVNILLNPVSKARQTSQPIFHDVDWFVKGYLASAPTFVQEIPEVAPEILDGAATRPNGSGPLGQFPGTSRPPKISGLVSEIILPGTYLMEIGPQYSLANGGIRGLNPEQIVQILHKFGVTSQILPTPPGMAYRFVTQIMRPLRFKGFLTGLRWRLLRKL